MPLRFATLPGLLLAAGCSGGPPVARDGAPPSFLLVLTDDQGWGEVGHRGHPWLETPALDALAAEGLTLERFYAAAPVCSPTRASLLTGRHPTRTRTFSWGHELPAGERTLAELLAERGYATGHFGKWHLGSVRAGQPTSPGAQGFSTWLSAPNFFDLDPLLSSEGRVVEAAGEGSDVITDAALEFVDRSVESGRPFLAVVWYGNPHLPHVAPPDDLAAQEGAPEDARAYYAEIAAIDRNVGRLRARLAELGVARSTLVWFTSDNGPRAPGSAADHQTGGLRGVKGTLWEGGLRVPSLVAWPDAIPPGITSDEPCGTVDVLPTVLELAGATPPAGVALDGVSLVPLLQGSPLAVERGLGFWMPPIPGRVMPSDEMLAAQREGRTSDHEAPPVVDLSLFGASPPPGRAAWIAGPWKLHVVPGDEGGRVELYDLAADPAEAHDLAAARPDECRRLRAELEAWRGSIVRELLQAR